MKARRFRFPREAIRASVLPGEMDSLGLSRAGLRYAFSLVELLVVIAIIGLLASLLFPALSRGKAHAKSAVCQSNLRQFGLALSLYLFDYNVYPLDHNNVDHNSTPMKAGTIWYVTLLPYTARAKEVWFCPANPPVFRWR